MKLSASQIIKFIRCQREWYYSYVKKIPVPRKPWLKTGNDFHEYIEGKYQKLLGKTVEEGYYSNDITGMVDEAWDTDILYIPQKFIVEKSINFVINEEASLTGKVDLIDVTKAKIIDHKTFNDKKYTYNEEELKENIQLNIYAFWYLNKIPKRNTVFLRHNYLNKIDSCMNFFTEVEVTREEVYGFWNNNVIPVVHEMIKLSKTNEENCYKCNTSKCGEYGGCDFLSVCR